MSLVTRGEWVMRTTTIHVWKVGMGGGIVVVGGQWASLTTEAEEGRGAREGGVVTIQFDHCIFKYKTQNFASPLKPRGRHGRMGRRGRSGMWKERNVQHDDRAENRGVTVCETCM
jgi:hypothetical protein